MERIDRIAKLFSSCREKGRAAFVTYVCACDPNFDLSLEICKSLIDRGADLLELGVPFSDPLADGLTNQLAAQRALEAGCKQEDVFRLVREIRKFSEVPIVFYTYYNLVYSQGVEEYVRRAKEAGVDGLLTLDLPPEEAEELIEASKIHEMHNIFIIAPTTPQSRIPKIVASASGFLYYVSREGGPESGRTWRQILVIGFKPYELTRICPWSWVSSISSPEQVREVASHADGVVVGSSGQLRRKRTRQSIGYCGKHRKKSR